jgi:hypothetical protein
LDTLILFQNADVSVLEAKTHRQNADYKKIESNIKQLRDFGGAYSAYNLIYPLTATDLAALDEGGESVLGKFKGLGMEDLAAWQKHLQDVRLARDQSIIGLDQLDRVMGARRKF